MLALQVFENNQLVEMAHAFYDTNKMEKSLVMMLLDRSS
jgi:hypothetical protein